MHVKALTALILSAAPLAAQQPLSAIDWLDDAPTRIAVTGSNATSTGTPEQAKTEAPIANTATTPNVEVMTLDSSTTRDAVGLLPSSKTGLPANLWSASDARDVISALADIEATVPAISTLVSTLLLAEADPPAVSEVDDALLIARIERLIEDGAVDAAAALLERADPNTKSLFPLWFDVTLLLGDMPEVCTTLLNDPSLAHDLSQRIFCLARAGQWHQASLTLSSAEALGQINQRDADLLTRFLDPEMGEDTPMMPPPSKPSVLQFRLYESIGEPLPSYRLPRKFAVTELSGDQGWRAQIVAAERLARAGTLSSNRLLGIYTMRRPAASGGIWDRVEALQRFDRAITTRDPKSVGTALVNVWPKMKEAGLLVSFAELYADKLQGLPMSATAREVSAQAALLSPLYEEYALALENDPTLAFEAQIARGIAPTQVSDRRFAAEIAAGFADQDPSERVSSLLKQGKLGEAILQAIALFQSGVDGNGPDLTEGLAALRKLGLEDTARRAALQLLIAGPSQS